MTSLNDHRQIYKYSFPKMTRMAIQMSYPTREDNSCVYKYCVLYKFIQKIKLHEGNIIMGFQ